MSSILTVPTIRPQPVITDLPVWRFSVADYRRLSETGVLNDDDELELLEGLLVPKMPKNPPHILVCKLLRRYLERLLGDGWHVATQDPLSTEDSEPEPDLAVLRGCEEDYGDRLPTSADSPLVIEVADTTLSRDRGIKRRIYARTGIQHYWIANVAEKTIEVYSEPIGEMETPGFASLQKYSLGESVPVELDGQKRGEIAVASIFISVDAK
ncbi:MAG: Uma2 family endonuclease [Planctomycetaceae bacterium]|nr:Uma2 family endonuclease [Planctomycetaceae bacterium]